MVDLPGFGTEYMAGLATELTARVLDTLGRQVRQAILGTPREQALVRCYQAANAALLPEDDPARETLLPILREFLARPAVQAELAKLTRGREPDQELLAEAFAEAGYGVEGLPPFDFRARLAASVEAFLQAVELEPVLADTVQVAQLRDATASLRALVTDTAAIRRILERLGYRVRSGDVTLNGQARDIVTGVQIKHIVNNYRVSGGTWSKEEYRAALERYLDWVRAAYGRVVLRGIIKRQDLPGGIELPLDEVYVPLMAEALPQAREQVKRGPAVEMGETAQAERITMREVLARGSRLAVIGAPGCGKTTVLYHIAWTLAEALRTDQPDLATERLGLSDELPLPVYVPLNSYAEHCRRFANDRDPHQRQLATFISHYLTERQAGLKLPDDFFATLLNQGRHVILLLDGLDEVPNEDERALVSQAVSDLTYSRPNARFVVTSRPRAYQGRAVLEGGFRVIEVLPLDPEMVADLIRRAYQAIYPADVEKAERESRAADLIAGVEKLEADRAARPGDEEEKGLVTTPLMVRMLLIVHFNRTRLPDQRAELYEEVVDTLLTSDYNPDRAVAQRVAQLGGDWRTRRDMLQYLAFQMHSRGAEAGREIGEREMAEVLCAYLTDRLHKPPKEAQVFVDDFISVSRQRGGLLDERAGRHLFSHLSFQEFLTARYLAESERDVDRMAGFIEEGDRAAASWWREPVLLTVGYLNVTATATATELVRRLAGLDTPQPPHTSLALAAAELAATAFLEWGGADATRGALARRLADLLTDPALRGAAPPLRAAAGRALARLGDPRQEVGVVARGSVQGDRRGAPLPEIGWCKVAAGPFLLGANVGEEDAYKDERPQHELTLPAFYIARYPVTNAQFAPFVAAGYDDPQWWTPAGWEWRTGAEPDLASIRDEDLRKRYAEWLAQRRADRRQEPFYWQDERLNLPNQPVVGVNWYEAMAYCAWLERQLAEGQQLLAVGDEAVSLSYPPTAGGYRLRLPTEAEWEKAAGWDPVARHKRVYAWGDGWDEEKANVDNSIGRPSAVGVFPAGAAACGALDMTGNVWEWTLSLYKGYRYRSEDGREDPLAEGTRAVRGGSWYDTRRYARVSARNGTLPDNFNYTIGFRVVVVPV